MAFEENWANDYVSTLAAPFDHLALSAQVVSAAGAPAAPFRWKVITAGGAIEYIMVRSVAGTTFSWNSVGADRGLEGGSALDHLAGETCGAPITAGGLAAGLVRQILSGASGNLSLSPAGGQGPVTADIIAAPTFAGIATAAGVRDSRGQAGANSPFVYGHVSPSGANSFSLVSGLPTTWSHLQILWQGRGDQAALGTVFGLQFNGDGGANYDDELFYGTGNASATESESLAGTNGRAGSCPAATATAGNAGAGEIWIPNYSGTTFKKNWSGSFSRSDNESTGTQYAAVVKGKWRSTAAIASIVVLLSTGSWVTGTLFTLIVWP